MNGKSGMSRLLFGIAAAVYCFGAAAHTQAFFGSASQIIDNAAVKGFFGNELKVLWLADSTTLLGLGILYGLMAAKPTWAARSLAIAVTWIPAATTGLLYVFLGPFYAAHLLVIATVMALIAALMLPVSRPQGS